MINYFEKKVLYVNSFASSFGDGFDNLRNIKSIREVFNKKCLIHTTIHPTTLECLNWHICSENSIDRLFIVKNDEDIFHKIYAVPDNFYDLIVLEHCNVSGEDKSIYKYFRERFKNAEIIFYDDGIANKYNETSLRKFFDKHNVLEMNYDSSLHEEIEINEILKCAKFEKKVVLFPFSTRSLASFQLNGIIKFCKYFNDLHYSVYIAGETFDPYQGGREFGSTFLSKQIKELLESNIDGDVINIMGFNTSKLIKVCNNSDLIVMSPTGINLLSFNEYIKTKTIILQHGDSEIMRGISIPYAKHIHKNKKEITWEFIKTECEYFPCQNKNEKKPMSCHQEECAKCLSNEFIPNKLLK